MQMLTDEVQERTRPVVGGDGCASPGRAVLSRRVVFCLCLRNGSCEPKRESGDDRSAARQCRVATTRRWRSAGGCARQVALNLAGLCFAAGTAIIAEKHLNRVIIPAADRHQIWEVRGGETFSMYKYSLGFAGPLSRAGASSCGLCLETDHSTEECALSMRRRGGARTSLLLRCDFSPCPAAVLRRSAALSWVEPVFV